MVTLLILTSSSWHYHFGGTGLHIDRDTTVRDDKGNEYPEPRSLHSMTRYLGSFHLPSIYFVLVKIVSDTNQITFATKQAFQPLPTLFDI